ncbi:unnamed protein product [Heligmosomoides polygyrus]|uniref:Uncharacterized protein n=1 Tax=Heligmosomoides polygyrus TaxID=6339 RepID=A0A183FQL2_HELPZ|nr:unnamed protein product [Heligmosomoides polygyrus]
MDRQTREGEEHCEGKGEGKNAVGLSKANCISMVADEESARREVTSSSPQLGVGTSSGNVLTRRFRTIIQRAFNEVTPLILLICSASKAAEKQKKV